MTTTRDPPKDLINGISEYRTILKTYFMKSGATEGELASLQNAIDSGLKQNMETMIHFVLWDAIEECGSILIDIKELTNTIHVMIKTEQHAREISADVPNDSTKKMKAELKPMDALYEHGKQIVITTLQPLLHDRKSSINIKALSHAIDHLKTAWTNKVNDILTKDAKERTHLIEDSELKLKNLCQFTYDIFTIRAKYAIEKQNNYGLLKSRTISPKKSKQLALIENALVFGIHCSEDPICQQGKLYHFALTILEKIRAETEPATFGKSTFAGRIDDMIQRCKSESSHANTFFSVKKR